MSVLLKIKILLILGLVINLNDLEACNSISDIIKLVKRKEITNILDLKIQVYGSDSSGTSELYWLRNDCLQGNKYLNNRVSTELNYFFFDITDYKSKFRNIHIAGIHRKGIIELLIISDNTKGNHINLLKFKSVGFENSLIEYNNEFNASFESKDIDSKYLESRTLGAACGAGGAPTDGFIFMMNLVRLKKKKKARRLLFSMNSQDRLIGAFAVEFLDYLGIPKTDIEQNMIDKLMESKSIADYCSGCITQWSSIGEVLSNKYNHEWYYQYKKIWKF